MGHNLVVVVLLNSPVGVINVQLKRQNLITDDKCQTVLVVGGVLARLRYVDFAHTQSILFRFADESIDFVEAFDTL